MNTNDHPRMSLNKVAEFIVSPSDAHKRRLVPRPGHKIKPPPWHYRMPRLLSAHLIDGVPTGLLVTEAQGYRRSTKSDWDARDGALTAAAFPKLVELLPRITRQGREFLPGRRSARMLLGGVEVTIAPDLLVREVRDGREFLGALKLHNVKGRSLGPVGAAFVAAVLRSWLGTISPAGAGIDPALCFSVEPWHGTVMTAPDEHARAMARVLAGCVAIRRIWESYDPPERDAA